MKTPAQLELCPTKYSSFGCSRTRCGRAPARVTAALARGKYPVPSRTRKSSLSAPMVLQPEGCGRVGRRRTSFRGGHPLRRVASLAFPHQCVQELCTAAPGELVVHRVAPPARPLSAAPGSVVRGGDADVSTE